MAVPVLLVFVIFIGARAPPTEHVQISQIEQPKERDTRPAAPQKTIEMIKGWIKDCDSHPCLKQKILKFHLPTRVIDITDFDKKGARRIFLKSSHGLVTEKYICLSYCWGGQVPLQLLKENKLEMEDRIALESLPKLFHDFISVAASLGARYVWIDALCIIQDDAQDWEKEAASMNLVYGNSYLTIAATAADNPTCSLFPWRLSGGVSVIGSPLTERAYRDSSTLHGGGEVSKWSTRGWTFQEYLLSPRVLHFGAFELVWHCNEGQHCECGNVTATQSLREARMTHLRGTFKLAVKQFTTKEHWLKQDTLEHEAAQVAAWHTCAERYSERTLSDRGDHVVAISGIAQAFTKAQMGKYYAGVWESSFVEDLCWWPRGASENTHDSWKASTAGYLAPSWSWLATGRSVIFTHQDYFWSKHSELQDCEIRTGSSGKWGKVIGGNIKILAYGARIQLSVNSKRQLYIHPEYLNKHAGELERENDNDPCGTLDRDPTINEERNGISAYCLLAGIALDHRAVMIVVEEAEPPRTPRDSESISSSMGSASTSVSMISRIKRRLQDKTNPPTQPTPTRPKTYRRIGIIRARLYWEVLQYQDDQKGMVSWGMFTWKTWNII